LGAFFFPVDSFRRLGRGYRNRSGQLNAITGLEEQQRRLRQKDSGSHRQRDDLRWAFLAIKKRSKPKQWLLGLFGNESSTYRFVHV
jgi:hypothetical protein